MKVVKCDCKHEYQDKELGEGKRYANKTASVPPKFRCTVCRKEHA